MKKHVIKFKHNTKLIKKEANESGETKRIAQEQPTLAQHLLEEVHEAAQKLHKNSFVEIKKTINLQVTWLVHVIEFIACLTRCLHKLMVPVLEKREKITGQRQMVY